MSLIHILDAFSKGGLTGIQAQQRDWSPYVVHFTSWGAMKPFREIFKATLPTGNWSGLPQDIHSMLEEADRLSLDLFAKICQSGELLAQSPNSEERIPKCVCFSECNLPGLISLSERYGRFGFVFSKEDILPSPLNGRPCLYVDDSIYTIIDKNYSSSTVDAERRLFGLANVYSPRCLHVRIQDYTPEREWRAFANVPLSLLRAVICPAAHYDEVVKTVKEYRQGWLSKSTECKDSATETEKEERKEIPVFPIDMLFDWGA